jgi:hypothetical protein
LLITVQADAGEPVLGGFEADATLGADEPMKGGTLDSIDLSFVIDDDLINDVLDAQPFASQAACTFFAQNGGKGRKGVKVRFSGGVITADGTEPIPPGKKKTDKNGNARMTWDLDPDEQATGDITVNVTMDPSGSKKADVWGGKCRVGAWKPCETDDTTLCLNDNRFKVSAEWRDFDGSTGPGMANPLSDIQGSFYFFNPNNRNLLVDLLDACKNNDFFWVFAAAATDVEYTLSVTDTHAGTSKSYFNELGTPAPAITDTQAFATCP